MHSTFHTLADSGCACLVIPGLLAAEAVGTSTADTPHLCRLLSRASVFNNQVEDFESIIWKWFRSDTTGYQNCAACLGHRFELQGSNATVMRADPVFQQMDINHAVLADQSILDLELPEARALVSTLNQHFEADGICFELADAERWYCTFKQPLDIRTRSLSWSVGRDVSIASPAGADASKWRTLLAEIEMLLYSHPVNEQRQLAGKVPVNSLWLWGEGIPAESKRTDTGKVAVYCDSFYTRSVAHSLHVATREFAALGGDRLANHSLLIADDRLKRAAATADIAMRTAVLQDLEEQVFKPLWGLLGGNGIKSLQLWTGGDRLLQLDAAARYKFWRRSKPLEHFISHNESIDHDS